MVLRKLSTCRPTRTRVIRDIPALLTTLEQHGVSSFEDLGDSLIGEAAEQLRAALLASSSQFFVQAVEDLYYSGIRVCLVVFQMRSRQRLTMSGDGLMTTLSLYVLQLGSQRSWSSHGADGWNDANGCKYRDSAWIVRSC